MHTRRHAVTVFMLVLWIGGAIAAAAPTDEECMVCHGDPGAAMSTATGKVVSLYLDQAVYGKSKHAEIGCTSCHNDIDELPHPEKLAPVDCSVCHAEAEEYAQSLHGRALASGDKDIGGCMDCHGKHDIRGVDDPLSHTNKHNLPQTCGKCHSDSALVHRHMVSVVQPSQAYVKSTHANAIREGNLDAAVCSACHGAHNILPAHTYAQFARLPPQYRRHVRSLPREGNGGIQAKHPRQGAARGYSRRTHVHGLPRRT
ncbi:MAG: hypothetical protein HYV26_01595 [Candidatus Hydrogenedentes bacterium]|nr:hypothetical protein [Candidatus Hydrogenedentota bacterium]